MFWEMIDFSSIQITINTPNDKKSTPSNLNISHHLEIYHTNNNRNFNYKKKRRRKIISIAASWNLYSIKYCPNKAIKMISKHQNIDR